MQVISLAEVKDRVDPQENGSFLASIDVLDNDVVRVHYVSPYGSTAGGGFVAIPEIGTRILVCQPADTEGWYYLGSTFEPEPPHDEGDTLTDLDRSPLSRVLPDAYSSRGTPVQMGFKNTQNAGLEISDDSNPTQIAHKTELRSSTNKRVSLLDSPSIDSIILDSGNGSKITLSSDPENQSLAKSSFQVETAGPQKLINMESQTDIFVGEGGRELQILNNANGVEWGSDIDCGNVNIQSKWKDVNIFSQAEQGRIFIECLSETGNDQWIQIETNGTGGGITIKTQGDVNIDAGNNLNIEAKKSIRMKTGGKFSIDSGSFEVQANQVNIDPGAGTVQLANGASTESPDLQSRESTYNNDGITTY